MNMLLESKTMFLKTSSLSLLFLSLKLADDDEPRPTQTPLNHLPPSFSSAQLSSGKLEARDSEVPVL